ncbi:hypothetical protein B296_00006167 [Ensete ventricosum]|uniref:Uncharacterized protein n=1 Tax=Ensete ventricosum TaxID=4639 RepID=A0A427ADD6_ENSVE|nr:hypothetical protein B296_00006167 [Ensete ventricosum]
MISCLLPLITSRLSHAFELPRPSSRQIVSRSLASMSALRRNLARRFTSLLRPFPTATPASVQAASAGDHSLLCRSSFQKWPFFQPPLPPDRTEMPVWGDRRLAERIRGLCPNRIRLDEKRVSLEEIKKVVRASQVAAARERLGATGKRSVPYREFVRICCESSSSEQGFEIARSLEESGVVIVIGNTVFLRPEEVHNSPACLCAHFNFLFFIKEFV